MALSAHVIARIANKRLSELTNTDSNTAAGVVNTTILGLACTDAESLFAERCGTTYVDTVSGDIRIAVRLVIGILVDQSSGDTTYLDKALEAATEYAKTRGRDRRPGYTASRLTPSTEVETGDIVRPWSDADSWDGYSPRAP